MECSDVIKSTISQKKFRRISKKNHGRCQIVVWEGLPSFTSIALFVFELSRIFGRGGFKRPPPPGQARVNDIGIVTLSTSVTGVHQGPSVPVLYFQKSGMVQLKCYFTPGNINSWWRVKLGLTFVCKEKDYRWCKNPGGLTLLVAGRPRRSLDASPSFGKSCQGGASEGCEGDILPVASVPSSEQVVFRPLWECVLPSVSRLFSSNGGPV